MLVLGSADSSEAVSLADREPGGQLVSRVIYRITRAI
jgi:hypothetical protein